MRAADSQGAGDVRIEAVAPGDPGPGEVLIAASMAAICVPVPDVGIEASGVPQNPSTAIHATKRGGRVVIVALICDLNLPESLAVLAQTELAGEVLAEGGS